MDRTKHASSKKIGLITFFLIGASLATQIAYASINCNMASVKVYSTLVCPYCTQAKQLLQSLNIDYEEVRVDTNEKQREEMERLSGKRTVPQIFINGESIGGFTDLQALHSSGKLKNMLC